jgi:tetratricopeptide (TPR) repeat protein
MTLHSASPSYAAAELRAYEHRTNHAFIQAAGSAHDAAQIARNEGDMDAWWNMTFLKAENLLDAEEFETCAALASDLVDGPYATTERHAKAGAQILVAKARQGAGLLEEAVDAARAAVQLVSDDDVEIDVEIDVKARQALIAALADSGRLDEAWTECLALAEAVSAEVDDQLIGKVYWVIGNVAFLCSRVREGLKYHELAAATFSPARNLDVWAKFNKASAAMRLAADIADADTLRCIERAELATDVIGGSANDYLLMSLNRAHWNFLAGEPNAAIELLEQICADLETPSPQILGEACLLLGRSQAALGNADEARKYLLEAADHFEKAGAPQRAEQAVEFLREAP